MKPFRRFLVDAVRRRPLMFAGTLASSLVVASLWGVNISVLYPMTEIVFKGDTVDQYVQKRLDRADADVAAVEAKLASVGDGDPLRRDSLKLERDRINAEVATYRRHRETIRRWSPSTPFRTLIVIVGILIGGTALKLVALGCNTMIVRGIVDGSVMDLRNRFFRHCLHMDLDHYGDTGSSDLTSRLVGDIGGVGGGIKTLLGRMVVEPMKMIVCVCGAMSICPRLFALVMVIAPLTAWVMSSLSRAIRRSSKRTMEEMSRLYARLSDAFAGIRVVKAFNTHAHERAKFAHGNQVLFARSRRLAWYGTLARSTSEMLGMTMVSLAILGGGYLVVNQETHLLGMRMTHTPINVGHMLLFFGFLIGASDPARKLADVWSGLQRGIAAAERVDEVLSQSARVQPPDHPVCPPRPHRAIWLADVRYAYPSGPRVLDGIDLSIRHGETVAIVGPNGSGKSTIINLLCRFDDPQHGRVMIDDTPLTDLHPREWRRRIALVTQRTVLFDDTIENNIRYGSPGADLHDVVRVAKLAHADEFIRHKTPDGYRTRLGSGGMRLSGGQMQRIALARAFLRNPDVLILDEATSAIDLESEQLIHEALAKFLVDRTGVMITHRPTSLAMADRTIVIENGKVAGDGSHAKLLAKNAFYRSLCGGESGSWAA